MKLFYAFGFVPVPVIPVPYLFGAGGFSPLFCILILKDRKDDVGVLTHELTHIEQAWKCLILPFALLYLCNRRFRLWSEVQAYRQQIATYDGDTHKEEAIKWAVECLMLPMYRFNLSVDEARRLLTS